ncbi:MAG TPA: hypothetical protein VHH92_07945 [Actinomycetota bacterium]|nr:hypothetical protein [Actinomycetota bacterium]
MTRQAAMLLALGALATASAVVSFGAWILLRRGTPPPEEDAAAGNESEEKPAHDPGWIAD